MQDKIIAFLKSRHQCVLGEEISRNLGISRQALWRHVQELRDAGYDIVAIPHQGYRLVRSPDRLYPFEISQGLSTKVIGRKIYYFDKVSSTMDAAMQLGFQNALEGTVVVSESQTKGRGRLGRSWSSPKYKGLYFSFILRPDIPANQAPVLTLMTAVSICEAIKKETGLDPQIKWPNDILLGDKKLCGILTELEAEIDAIRFVVIGIGLNANNNADELVDRAVSLKAYKGEHINRAELLRSILRRIEENYAVFKKKGPSCVLEKCIGLSLTLGRKVRLICHNRHFDGEAVDIDSDGGLLVRGDSGLVEKFMAGDVVHLR
jgi:BirA family biotin operon repressor/biotin-[acetyl-CoA-carboxylase] ligase